MSVGVVILSNANTPSLSYLTEQLLSSLGDAAPKSLLDVVVVEQTARKWPLCMTINRSDEFNFNRYANLGVERVCGDHLLICNNDIRLSPGSIDRLHDYAVTHGTPVVCPVCPLNPKQADLVAGSIPEVGTEVGRHFTGWCFLMARQAWLIIGGFDEDFPFWYADNATVEQLKRANLLITVLPDALVSHHASQTLKTLPRPERIVLTKAQRSRFEAKYGPLIQTLVEPLPSVENG